MISLVTVCGVVGLATTWGVCRTMEKEDVVGLAVLPAGADEDAVGGAIVVVVLASEDRGGGGN